MPDCSRNVVSITGRDSEIAAFLEAQETNALRRPPSRFPTKNEHGVPIMWVALAGRSCKVTHNNEHMKQRSVSNDRETDSARDSDRSAKTQTIINSTKTQDKHSTITYTQVWSTWIPATHWLKHIAQTFYSSSDLVLKLQYETENCDSFCDVGICAYTRGKCTQNQKVSYEMIFDEHAFAIWCVITREFTKVVLKDIRDSRIHHRDYDCYHDDDDDDENENGDDAGDYSCVIPHDFSDTLLTVLMSFVPGIEFEPQESWEPWELPRSMYARFGHEYGNMKALCGKDEQLQYLKDRDSQFLDLFVALDGALDDIVRENEFIPDADNYLRVEYFSHGVFKLHMDWITGEDIDIPTTKRCPYYGSAVGCQFGTQCDYAHTQKWKVPECHFFKKGRCWNGDQCRFRHN